MPPTRYWFQQRLQRRESLCNGLSFSLSVHMPVLPVNRASSVKALSCKFETEIFKENRRISAFIAPLSTDFASRRLSKLAAAADVN
uniref:Uncharacterized protein n=1 Tax=Onchocerca volvulus TaxID=6282 RepID=A0A8R1XN77_ONCVO